MQVLLGYNNHIFCYQSLTLKKEKWNGYPEIFPYCDFVRNSTKLQYRPSGEKCRVTFDDHMTSNASLAKMAAACRGIRTSVRVILDLIGQV